MDVSYMMNCWLKLELQAVETRRTADRYKLKIIEEVQRAQAPTDEKENENGIERATLQYPEFSFSPADVRDPPVGRTFQCGDCNAAGYCSYAFGGCKPTRGNYPA